MTQQQVFSLYLANPNQMVKNRHGEIALDYRFMLSNRNLYNSPDSKLILKRIADMSEDDKKIFDDMSSQFVFFETCETYIKEAGNLTIWLITHGYCLDEQWIENGWVTCQK